jgi:hypothetical protein
MVAFFPDFSLECARDGRECGVVKREADAWICPDCGAEVEVGVRDGCPCCRRVEERRKVRRRTKRKKRALVSLVRREPEHDGLSLPEEDFDYDEFVEREFGRRKAHEKIGISPVWWWTALVLLALMVGALLGGKLFRWMGW